MGALRTFTDVDREMFLAERAYEIEMAEIAAMEAALDASLRINLAKCELKVLTESGDVSDLAFLIEAAEAEAEGQKANIVVRIFSALGKALGSIVDAIKRVFTGKSAEELKKANIQVSIPKDAEAVLNDAENLVNQSEGPLRKVAAATGTMAIISAAGAAISVALNKTHVLDNFIKGQTAKSAQKQAAADSAMSTGEAAYAQQVVDAMKAKNIADRLISLAERVKGLSDIILKAWSNVKGAVSDVANKVTGKGKDNGGNTNPPAGGDQKGGQPQPAAQNGEQPKQEGTEDVEEGEVVTEADEGIDDPNQGMTKIKIFINLLQKGLSKLGNMIMAGWNAAVSKLKGKGNSQSNSAANAGAGAVGESVVEESANDNENWDPIQAMMAGLGVGV